MPDSSVMIPVTTILLCAGLSRRMGDSNKLLFPTADGSALIAVVASRLGDCDADETVVVLGHQAERVRAVLAERQDDWAFVINPDYAGGMTSSIQTGVRAASETSLGFMICLGDQPFLGADDYQDLLDAFRARGGRSIVVPEFEGRRGNPVVFPASLKGEILSETSAQGCRAVVEAHPELVSLFEARSDAFLRDIDRPAQLQAPPFIA